MRPRLAALETLLAGGTLAAALAQTALGARLGPTGEQLGFALPLATVIAAGWLAVHLLQRRRREVPWLGWGQAAFLALCGLALAGGGRAATPTALKELAQQTESLIVVAILAGAGVRGGCGRALAGWFAALGATALVLGATGLREAAPLRLSAAKCAAFGVMATPFLLEWLGRQRRLVGGAGLLATAVLAGLGFEHAGLLAAWGAVLLLAGRLLRAPALGWGLAAVVVALGVSGVPGLHATSPWARLNPRYDAQHLKRVVIEWKAAALAPRRHPLGAGLGRYKPAINDLRLELPDVPHPRDQKVPTDGNSQYAVVAVECGAAAAVALIVMLGSGAVAAGRRWRAVPPDGDPRLPAAVAGALVGALLSGLFALTLSRGIGLWVGALVGMAGAWEPVPTSRGRLARWGLVGVGWVAGAGALMLLGLGSGAGAARLRIEPLEDEPTAAAAGELRVEGEAAQSFAAPFVAIPANGASGNQAVAIPEAGGKGVGEARYTLDIPAAGIYTPFARVFWQDGCGNSVLLQVGSDTVTLSSERYQVWHTVESRRRLSLPAGPVTVRLRNAEDGIRVDYWGLKLAR